MPTKKPAVKYAISKAGAVSFDLAVPRHGLEPIMAAAYLLTDRAYAALEGDRERRIVVTLRPKGPAGTAALKALAKQFIEELGTQETRWALARENQPVREHVFESAAVLARVSKEGKGKLPPPTAEADGPAGAAGRAEIDRIIAEVEREIRS